MTVKKPDQNLPADTELNDQDLGGVTGGTSTDYLLTIDGIKGESKDDKHKDTIHIESYFRKP
jgi:type VI protein secretion system component Hcp